MSQSLRDNAITTPISITNAFLRGVYAWMAIGLTVTAFMAWSVAGSYSIMNFIYGNSMVFIGLIIAQFGIVIILSAAISKLSAPAATALFVLYSALTGVTLSSIFIIYTTVSIYQIFFISAGMFAAISIYGLVTKRDLTSMGSFCMMGLFGLIIAMIINLFLQSPAVYYGISAIGVFIFLGLTAYDTQKLRNMGLNVPQDDETAIRRATIFGALTLYLDFINLFLMLLRLFGDRR